MKKGLSFKMQGESAAEIFLYDSIGEFWGEGIGAKAFAQILRDIGDVDSINLRINSPGGDVFDGYAIYNQLVRNSARIVVDVDGMAASIASVIAMAGEEIRIADNALMMIHNPWSLAMGDAEELRKTADLLDVTKDNCITCYQKRSPLEAENISQMMDDETWMTGIEALENGFATEVTGEQAIAALYMPAVVSKWIKHVPDVAVLVDEPVDAEPMFDLHQLIGDNDLVEFVDSEYCGDVRLAAKSLSKAFASHIEQIFEKAGLSPKEATTVNLHDRADMTTHLVELETELAVR